MINLLPKSEKEGFIQEENLKLVFILGIIFFTFLISFALILFSIKIYISGQIEVQTILLRQKELEGSQVQDLQSTITQSNLAISRLNSFYQETFRGSEILERISQTLPSAIYLTNLNLSTVEGEYPVKVSLSGFSPNREVLLEFKKNLEYQEFFKEIYFPPSVWIKATNIDFSLTFKISK